MLIGIVVFDLIGIDGFKAVVDIFLSPLLVSYKWQDVAVKAAPLIIIALGLSVGNRANVWNIGAEGQYIIGAVCAGYIPDFGSIVARSHSASTKGARTGAVPADAAGCGVFLGLHADRRENGDAGRDRSCGTPQCLDRHRDSGGPRRYR